MASATIRVQRREAGQASLLMLGAATLLLGLAVVFFAFGSALGSKGKHQRAADLAAVSAGQVMRDLYPRLFEPPLLENGLPNPRHLPLPVYLALTRRAAVRGARRNGVEVSGADVSFPNGGFAPTRVAVRVRGVARVRVKQGSGGHAGRGGRGEPVPVEARAAAEITPDLGVPLGMPAFGSGGGYDGPLAYRMGKPMRPDVAEAFDRMAAAARNEAGFFLSINSAFRSDAEQARLFAANPNPKWVAPPGTSLHRWATELDLGPPAAYPWLQVNHARFGFIWRYKWEPWHYGSASTRATASIRLASTRARGSRPVATTAGSSRAAVFVPPQFHDPIARAALRWNVPITCWPPTVRRVRLQPVREQPRGRGGHRAFMPGTADAYGLDNPFDPIEAIDAQAHLMSDLLRQFDGTVALALAGYNAGAGAVERYGGIRPSRETRAYVTRSSGCWAERGRSRSLVDSR